ncbi:MAG: hypothetical protein R2713_15430 [Ilumatobacteraceae bacterium]
MLIDTHGGIELDRVHRFTNDWERTASSSSVTVTQQSRTPTTVKDGSTAAPLSRSNAAVSAWWRHRQAGGRRC